jgi:hypothetical protein
MTSCGESGSLPTALVAVALAGCSAGTQRPAGASASSTDPAVQQYLNAVNALCDQLLPKVVALTRGGSFDVPLGQFFRQLSAHQRLRDEFDHDLSLIPVPPAARPQAAALAAYIRFADELDAKRLHAARQGQAAYRREIERELRTAADDPSIAVRTDAGFHESCNAR